MEQANNVRGIRETRMPIILTSMTRVATTTEFHSFIHYSVEERELGINRYIESDRETDTHTHTKRKKVCVHLKLLFR